MTWFKRFICKYFGHNFEVYPSQKDRFEMAGHCHESMTFGNCYKCVFTQSENDDMETGSYEKIEVEP